LDKISVVIPCLNDQKGLEPTLAALESGLQEDGIPYEIIVVDDGSQPAIQQVSTRGESEWLRHEKNRGYGAALKTGIRAGSGELIMIIDCDGTYPAEKAGELYRLINQQGADMVIGSRGGINAKIPLLRRPAKWLLNRFAAALLGESVPDLNSGFRLFKKTLFERYETLFPQGFSFTSTITFAAISDGYKVIFHPIEYRGRIGSSTIRPIRDTYNFFLLIFNSTLYFNPLRILLPLSIFLVLLASGLLLYGKYFLQQIPDITVTVLYMLGMQVGLLGFLANVIVRRSKS